MAGGSFDVGLKSGLFTAKHRKRMGDAIWTFGTLVDWVTKEVPIGNSYHGIVLGGAAGIGKRLAEHLGYHKNTASAHLDRLEELEYILKEKGQGGYSVRVRNSKKWVRIREKRNPGEADSGGAAEAPIPITRIHNEAESAMAGIPAHPDSQSQSAGIPSTIDYTGTLHTGETPKQLVERIIQRTFTWGKWYTQRLEEEAERLGMGELEVALTVNADGIRAGEYPLMAAMFGSEKNGTVGLIGQHQPRAEPTYEPEPNYEVPHA